MTQQPRDLDARRGKASMEWYWAMRARCRGEVTAEGDDPAEARVREQEVELRKAIEAQKSSTSLLRVRSDRFLEHV